jgi:hypothetical protein
MPATATDVTRQELSHGLRRQSLLGEFGRSALQTRDIGQIVQRATELCAQGLETRFAKVLKRHGKTLIACLGKLCPFAGVVETLQLKVKLVCHLNANPQNINSKLVFFRGFTGADHDLPSIVHGVKQHGHFRRPGAKRRHAFLDERRELIRRPFRPSHNGFHR